jgi:hydroxyacylglutathione hydrolase
LSGIDGLFSPARDGRIRLENDGALELVFLGIGSAFSTRLFQSNFFVVKGGTHVMVDIGSRASIALARAGLSPLDIENLVPTHSHADHIGGMEELCLEARYAAPRVKGCRPGDYRPVLLTSADYAPILWDASLRGGLEYSEVNRSGGRMSLSDYVEPRLGKPLDGYDRPVYHHLVGDGEHAIDLKLVRTNHIPDSSRNWSTAFYSIGVLVDDRILVSGDTMFDPRLIEEFGSEADVVFHDCQDFTGGVHASYDELLTLPAELRAKMLLYHLPDGLREARNPQRDGFAGWARCFEEGSYRLQP